MDSLDQLKPLPKEIKISNPNFHCLIRSVWSNGFRCGVTEGEQRAINYERGEPRSDIEEGKAFIDEINDLDNFDISDSNRWDEL